MKSGNSRNNELLAFGALSAIAAAILLPGAGSPSQITLGDVPMYVLMTVSGMLEKGDFLVPRWNTKIDFSKPPLFHWITTESLKIFSNPFFAVRLPAIACSAACGLMTYAFGRLLRLSQARSGFAALIFMSSWGMFSYGRQPLLEAPLALTVLIALYGLVRSCVERNPGWLLLFGAGLGLSAMMKWGVGPLTIGLFATAYLWAGGHWRWMRNERFWFAVAAGIAAAIALPYPIYIASYYSREFRVQIFAQVVTERYKESTGVLEFLVRGLLADFAPWTLMLMAAAYRWKRIDVESRAVLGSWLASVIVPVLLISSRTDRYLFAGLPALALLVASFDAESTIGKRCLMATVLGALLAAGIFLWGLNYISILTAKRCIAAFLLIAFSGAALVFRPRQGWGLPIFAGAVGLCMMTIFGVGYRNVGFNAIPDRILQKIGGKSIMRFDNQPEAASTGYLSLYLRRPAFIVGPDDLFDWGLGTDALIVASGKSLDLLKETGAQKGFSVTVIDSWENYLTNPRGSKIHEVFDERSLKPLIVIHYLVKIE